MWKSFFSIFYGNFRFLKSMIHARLRQLPMTMNFVRLIFCTSSFHSTVTLLTNWSLFDSRWATAQVNIHRFIGFGVYCCALSQVSLRKHQHQQMQIVISLSEVDLIKDITDRLQLNATWVCYTPIKSLRRWCHRMFSKIILLKDCRTILLKTFHCAHKLRVE